LDVLVNKNGKVNDLKIFKSSGHPLLDNAATSTVKHWLFEPGMIGDEKVDMWVRVPIRFELK
jgi:protein TonB